MTGGALEIDLDINKEKLSEIQKNKVSIHKVPVYLFHLIKE